MLEALTPLRDEIDQVKTRLVWLEKVEKQRPVIERTLETMGVNVPNRHPLGEKSMQWFGKCRYNLTIMFTVAVLRLFNFNNIFYCVSHIYKAN